MLFLALKLQIQSPMNNLLLSAIGVEYGPNHIRYPIVFQFETVLFIVMNLLDVWGTWLCHCYCFCMICVINGLQH